MPLSFFDGYQGYIHCDGFSGYDALSAKSPEIILSGCMYHVRRKFAEILKVTNANEGVAYDVLQFIARLANIEEGIKSLSIGDRFTARLEKA